MGANDHNQPASQSEKKIGDNNGLYRAHPWHGIHIGKNAPHLINS